MGYAKIDCVEYRVVWQPTKVQGSERDITRYIISHTANESLNIANDKLSLQVKLAHDVKLTSGYLAPFFANDDGSNKLKTDSILKIFVKYVDGPDSIVTTNDDDLLKTYYVTDWEISEPDNIVSINAVSLQYKVVNKLITRTYGSIESGVPTSATGTTFTDSGASFKTGDDMAVINLSHALPIRTTEHSW